MLSAEICGFTKKDRQNIEKEIEESTLDFHFALFFKKFLMQSTIFKNRNLIVLFFSQIFSMSGGPIVVLLGGIIGEKLSPNPALATMPIAIYVLGIAMFSIPASMIMKKIGRRYGFSVAAFVSGLAGLLATFSITEKNFMLFCFSIIFIGANAAFVQQYRFAAAESVAQSFVSKAISIVLLAGVFGAFLGPEVAKRTIYLLKDAEYAGAFVSLSILSFIASILLLFLKEIKLVVSEHHEMERPLANIVRQPGYIVALASCIVSYGVMTLVMTATPVQMHTICGFSLDETAWVIQSHIVAMFLPSFFTGHLIARFGLYRVLNTGILLLVACTITAMIDVQFIHFWLGLVLLGIGWNFLFVGGTTLLTQQYKTSERFKAQATNDFMVYGFQAVASLVAGTVIFQSSWFVLNILALFYLIVLVGILLGFHKSVSFGIQ